MRKDQPAEHHEIKQLFFAAQDSSLQGTDLDLWLSQRCGENESLHESVQKLLVAARQDDDLCDFADRAENKSPMDIRFPSGHRLGNFRIESLVGEGGMGIVYRAWQLEPIERTVAIKMIKPGMDSLEMLRRFQWEHTVLARLEHPHIARVLDAGQTDSGHPYFVMEFVAGCPITDACDSQQLSIAQRLQLFEQTCRAVRFAHQHGVLHRDLKPSNLLVSESDDEPTVKVIDFGVAKLMDHQDSLGGPVTRLLRVLGTRPYASPEQIDGDSSNIDTRADVFSLGVILYELIIGQPPESNVSDARPEPSAPAPQRPSVHFQSFDQATQSRIARQRSTHPADLARFIRSDLDWVLLKAIDPDRTERYGSVEAFTDDLTRFSAGSPVRARRQTQFYLARKFFARHRAITLIAVAFVTAILIALSVTRDQMKIARAAHQRSERLRLEVLDAQRQAASIVQAADLRLAAEAMEDGDYLEAADTLQRHHSTGKNPFARTALPASMASRFLHDRLRKSGNTLLTLERSLTALALDHQRRRIAVGDEHGVVTLAGLDEDFQQELPAGGQQEITGLAFANQSSRLFASDKSGIVRVFDWEAEPGWGTLYTPEVDSPDSVIDDFRISRDDQFLFLCVGSTVQVIDVATGKITQRLTGHRDSIDAIHISDDGQHIATGSKDHTSAVWNWPGGERILQSPPSEYRVTDVALTAGGDVLVDASVKGRVRWIDVASGKILHTGHVPSAIQTLATNTDASEVWVACRTGILYRLTQVESAESSLAGHRTQKTLHGVPHQIHLSRVYDCVWLDSSRALSVGRDGRMVLSNTATEATSYCDALSPNHLIAISADGRWVAGIDQQTIQLIDTGTGRAQSLLADRAEVGYVGIAFAPSGDLLMTTSDGRLVTIALESFNATEREDDGLPGSARPTETVAVHVRDLPVRGKFAELRFSDRGDRLMLFSRASELVVVLTYPGVESIFEKSVPSSYTADLSSSGQYLATSCFRDVTVDDLGTGLPVAVSTNHHFETINDLRFSPDEQWLYCLAWFGLSNQPQLLSLTQ